MLKVLKNSVVFYFMILFLGGCEPSINSEKELMIWLADAEHGFVKKTKANGFSLTMKSLPPEYLALNEMEKDNQKDHKLFGEYVKKFKNSRTFLLTLKHEDEQVNISNYKVSNLSQYSERVKELSFNIKDVIVLKTSSGKGFHPVLTTMEDLYEIGSKKSIYLVFSDDKNEIAKSEKLDIVFNDIYLDTGISHFVFKANKINNLPSLNFLNQ